MGKGNPKSSKEQPDDVHDGGKATCVGRSICNADTKGGQTNKCKFETLESKGNTNDGEAQDQTAENIFKKNEKTSKNDPDDIAY